jgi:hypothetical protein
MALLFNTILQEARYLLNDGTGAIFQDPPMLGLGNKVYRELQTKCAALGLPTTKEVSSPAIDVAIGVNFLGDGAGLPSDLLYPIRLWERADGQTSDEDYVDMWEENWEPNARPSQTLHVWAWREEQIKFVGATSAREVKMRYMKGLPPLVATNSPIYIINCETWFAQRLAAIASLVIGHNPTRASILNDDLIPIWDDLRATLVKRMQITPVRRRRTRYRVP